LNPNDSTVEHKVDLKTKNPAGCNASSFSPITKVDMQLIAEILKHLVKDRNMELMSMQAFIEYL
jgi:hypothetical protein